MRADIDSLDAAAPVIAASDGLQIQWLIDPGAVDVGRALSILERSAVCSCLMSNCCLLSTTLRVAEVEPTYPRRASSFNMNL
jgi:hypothetical protein